MHCIPNPYPQFHERTPAVAGTATGLNADPAVRTAEVWVDRLSLVLCAWLCC